MAKDKISIRMDFEGEDAEEFAVVMKKLGVKHYTEVIRVLIKREATA